MIKSGVPPRRTPHSRNSTASVFLWIFAALWFAAWHLFITWNVWQNPTALVPGPTGDNCMMLWNLGWVKYALNHGDPGFWCSAAFFPDGFSFIYGSHTWLDGVLYWAMSWALPAGWSGAVLWANITMLFATVGTGLLITSALRAWGVRSWPILLLAASGATFSWFRMFAMTGHYNFFGTQWMVGALCLLSWARAALIRGEPRRWKTLSIFAGILLGLAALNDQTLAIFGAILGCCILAGTRSVDIKPARTILAGGLRFYGAAFGVALIHLIPIAIAAWQGQLHYHVNKNLPRLVDASSFLLPNGYHFLGDSLKDFRAHYGLTWSEGTYLGIIPIALLVIATCGAIRHLFTKSPGTRICFYATTAAWVCIILGLGDRLTIGHEQFMVLPERLLKEIPLFNNMRVPQRWVWPAHLCIALAGASALSNIKISLERRRSANGFPEEKSQETFSVSRWISVIIVIILAAVPPLEGRSYPQPPAVDFKDDPVMHPTELIASVREKYTGGGALTMPIEYTYAQADVLQFLWGYDIPMTVVYSARMPFSVYDVPWEGSAWTPETARWLHEKKVSMIVFPFHGTDALAEFQDWINEARAAVPGIIILDKNGQVVP